MRWSFNALEQLLLWCITLGAIVVIGFQSGGLIAWMVYPSDPAVQQAPHAAAQDPQPETARTDPVVASIPPLFGTVPVNQPAPTPTAVETEIRYNLQGVSITQTQKWAMFALPGGAALLREGDTLPGGETLKQIRADAVLLEDGGALIAIPFSTGRDGSHAVSKAHRDQRVPPR